MVAPTTAMEVTLSDVMSSMMTAVMSTMPPIAIGKGGCHQGRGQQHNKNSQQAFHGDYLARYGSSDDIVKELTLGHHHRMTTMAKKMRQLSAVGKPPTMVTHKFGPQEKIARTHGSSKTRQPVPQLPPAHPPKPAQVGAH
jgi:hypothetical protein